MKKQLMAAGFVLFSLMSPLKASAATFNNIYVFGDSLSDTGNVFAASGQTFPPTSYGYDDGRFSNGSIWIDEFAKELNLDSPTPYIDVVNGSTPKGGINFAFGGATTTKANTISTGLFGLSQEIEAFQGLLIQNQQTADPNALYIVWFAANDYLPTQSQEFEPFTDSKQTLTNLSNALQSLANVGAKNIMVLNLPDLGNTPLAKKTDQLISGTSTRLNKLTQEHNTGLKQVLKQLNQNSASDLNIIYVDVNSLLSDTTKLGFKNVTEPCLNRVAQTICANPNEYLYWDETHPTARAHSILAGAALAAVPEPAATVGMLALGALGAGGVLKRKQKQLALTKASGK